MSFDRNNILKLAVASRVTIDAKPEAVWPLLCNFKLPRKPRWYYRAVPFPQECEVIGKKGLGAHRKCKTTKCHINQRITEWVPPNRLVFVVLSATGGLMKHVKRLEYALTLEEVHQKTLMTCSVKLDMNLHPILALARKPFLRFMMGKVQAFTIGGIKAIAESQASREPLGELSKQH